MAANLGTLTLDLIAKIGGFTGPLDKAGREAKKNFESIKQDAVAVGQAVGAMSVAAAGAFAALTVATVKSAGEISRFAQVSNAGVEEFQRYAAGAQALGVEQDKLADIFKDTSDKVGDFLTTGAGGMVDFFEQVAPKIGVTAEQFRNLSGPQALELYVSSLEKAGVSQNEMTFYLEALASDATLLLPLLKDNAAGFKAFGDEAARAGAIMDQDTIRAAQELNAAMFLADQSVDGLKNQISAALLPVLSDFAVSLSDVSSEGSVAVGIADALETALKGAAASAMGAYAAFQLTGKGLGGLAATVAAIPDGWDAVKRTMSVVGEDLDAEAQKYAAALEKIWSAGDRTAGEGSANARVKQLAEFMSQARTAASSAGKTITSTQTDAAKAAKKTTDAIASQVEALQLQVATLGMTSEEQALYKLALDGATESQLAQASAALVAIDAFEKQAEAKKKLDEAQQSTNDQARAIVESLRTEEEAVRASYDRRRETILASTELTAEQRAETLLRLENETNEQLLEANAGYWERYLEAAEESLQSFDELAGSVIENFSSQFGSAFESMIFDAESLEDAVSGMAESMARSVINALGQMAAQWLAYQLVQMLVGKTTQSGAATAMASNAAAASIQAGINAFASTAAIPIVGPPAAPAAMAAAIAATAPMAASVSALAMSGLAGMAHEGIDSIPQTGTWLLEKGERVTTAQTSAKLDKTLSDIQSSRQPSESPINVSVNVSGVTDSTGMRESGATIARRTARAVEASRRYT